LSILKADIRHFRKPDKVVNPWRNIGGFAAHEGFQGFFNRQMSKEKTMPDFSARDEITGNIQVFQGVFTPVANLFLYIDHA